MRLRPSAAGPTRRCPLCAVQPDTLPLHAIAASSGQGARQQRGRGGDPFPVTLLYTAAACLVVAQIVGIYGLVSRKADLIFSLCMLALVVISVVLGAIGAYQQLY